MLCIYSPWRHHGSYRFQIAYDFYVMHIRSTIPITADSCFQSIFWKVFVGRSLTKCHGPPRLNWTVSGVWPTIEALMSIGFVRISRFEELSPVLILMQVWLTFLICSNELLSDCFGMPEMSSGRYFSSFPLGWVPFETFLPCRQVKDTNGLTVC